MAKDPKQVTYLPELDRPNEYGKGTDKARLEFNTYASDGRMWSQASMVWEQPDGGITFMIGGDFTFYLPTVRGVRATQKALDAHHRNAFTNDQVNRILDEVRAFYANKAAAAA